MVPGSPVVINLMLHMNVQGHNIASGHFSLNILAYIRNFIQDVRVDQQPGLYIAPVGHRVLPQSRTVIISGSGKTCCKIANNHDNSCVLWFHYIYIYIYLNLEMTEDFIDCMHFVKT